MRTNYSLATFIGTAAVVLVSQSSIGQSSNIYSQARQSVVLIQNTSGISQGTGFIVNGDNGTYYVLTAGHVVKDGQFQVRTNSGEVRPVEMVNFLPGVDLALVQFTSSNIYTPVKLFNSNTPVPALTRIYILGYPANGLGEPEISGGNITSRQNSPSLGISSAIFHSVETKEGMSGSPVLNENGEVIGIHIGQPNLSSFREAIPIEIYRDIAPSIFTRVAIDNLANSRFDQAIASLEQVRRLFGQENPQVSLIRAYAYFGKGDLSRARDEVRQIGSSNAEAALLLGSIDYLQGSFVNAISNLNIARTLDRRNLGGYVSAIVGLSYAEISSASDANLNASSAIGLLPTDSFVYLASSCVKIKTTGDSAGARADLGNANRFSQQPPTNPFLAVLSPTLQQRARDCLPPELLSGTPVVSTPQIGRYKSSQPILLGEESTTLAVSRDSRYVATGLRDGTTSVYDLQSKNKIASFRSGQGRTDINSIAFSPDGRDIAVAAANGQVRVFNLQNGVEKYNIANAGNLPVVIFNNNNSLLFVGSSTGTLRMIDNRSGQTLAAETNTHATGIISLTLSPDGRLLATGGGDGIVKTWNVSDLTPIDGYQSHQSAVKSLAFSPDGSQIISIGDKAVKSCNWQNKSCNEIANSGDDVGSLAVASNGNIAFSEVSFLIRQDNPIFLQDLRSGQKLGSLLGHSDRVTALAYTPNSKFLISGSSDKTIIIWEVQ